MERGEIKLSLVRISLVALVFFTSESVFADDARVGAVYPSVCLPATAQAAVYPGAPILPDSGMKSDVDREKSDAGSELAPVEGSCGPRDESRPIASLIAMSGDGKAKEKSGDSETENEASEGSEENVEETDDSGIPGAVVAVIFGVFGLLVIARRNLR